MSEMPRRNTCSCGATARSRPRPSTSLHMPSPWLVLLLSPLFLLRDSIRHMLTSERHSPRSRALSLPYRLSTPHRPTSIRERRVRPSPSSQDCQRGEAAYSEKAACRGEITGSRAEVVPTFYRCGYARKALGTEAGKRWSRRSFVLESEGAGG